jgi:hypothetical protein
MVTRKQTKKLKFKPVTIYLTEADHEFMTQRALNLANEIGQPVSMTTLMRTAVQDYRRKIEETKAKS